MLSDFYKYVIFFKIYTTQFDIYVGDEWCDLSPLVSTQLPDCSIIIELYCSKGWITIKNIIFWEETNIFNKNLNIHIFTFEVSYKYKNIMY